MSPRGELHRIASDIFNITLDLRRFYLNPIRERLNIMDALDSLKALEPRLDAIASNINTDTATAVANAVAPLNEQISTLTTNAASLETATQAEADTLSAKVAVIEPLVGITPPAPSADPAPEGQ